MILRPTFAHARRHVPALPWDWTDIATPHDHLDLSAAFIDNSPGFAAVATSGTKGSVTGLERGRTSGQNPWVDTNQQNGKNSVWFDIYRHRMWDPNGSTTPAGKIAAVCVAKNAGLTGGALIGRDGEHNLAGRPALTLFYCFNYTGVTPNYPIVCVFMGDTNNNTIARAYFRADAIADLGWHVYSMCMSDNALRCFVDGVELSYAPDYVQYNINNVPGLAWPGGFNNLAVGADDGQAGAAAPMHGDVGLVDIAYNVPLAGIDALRQRMEGKAGSEWGLLSKFPSTHPWKNTPPTK